MIDNLDQAGRLLHKLQKSLPLTARAAPALAATVLKQTASSTIPTLCNITDVDYAGDEGGIMCRLAFDEDAGSNAFVVSITHLVFDRRHALAREIAGYQKHRIKRLRRE